MPRKEELVYIPAVNFDMNGYSPDAGLKRVKK